jgi:hypothetical protein
MEGRRERQFGWGRSTALPNAGILGAIPAGNGAGGGKPVAGFTGRRGNCEEIYGNDKALGKMNRQTMRDKNTNPLLFFIRSETIMDLFNNPVGYFTSLRA